MGSNPKRFLHATRCFENLSSGLKRAGCADCVGVPSGAVFCDGGGTEQGGDSGEMGQRRRWWVGEAGTGFCMEGCFGFSGRRRRRGGEIAGTFRVYTLIPFSSR